MARPSPFSIHFRSLKFSQIMAAKTLKTSHRLQTVMFIIYQKGEKTKIRKEKPKITYLLTMVIAFLAAENENRHLEHLSQADFRRVPEKNSSIGEERVNNWEFCKLKVTPIFCFCNDSTHFFILSLIAEVLNDVLLIIFGKCGLFFSFDNKIDFSCR